MTARGPSGFAGGAPTGRGQVTEEAVLFRGNYLGPKEGGLSIGQHEVLNV